MAEVLAHIVRSGVEEVDPEAVRDRVVLVVDARPDGLVLQDLETNELLYVRPDFECEKSDCSGAEDPYVFMIYKLRR